MANITSGKRLKDKKIDIYSLQQGQDALGGLIEEWNKLTEVPIWAYFRQIGGQEHYEAMAATSGEEVVFQINWRDDVDISARVVYRGKEYDIVRIDTFEGYKSDLKLYCKIVVGNDIL